jgi:tetratricopeptide (TPR) repeat protein
MVNIFYEYYFNLKPFFIFVVLLSFALLSKAATNPVLDFAKTQIEQKNYLAAISTINNFLEMNPKDKDALYWKGYCYYRLENFTAAEENYTAVLKKDSKFVSAYVDMANMRVKQKRFNDAIPFFNAAITLKDSSIDLINSRGMCYYYADKMELAIKDFKRIIVLDPKNYLAYNNKGSASYNNQNIAAASMIDLRSAEQDFNKAIELKPDFELAYRNRGIVRYFQDSLEKAYKDLLKATQMEPKDDAALYYLAKTLQKEKLYNIAIQFYDNSIKLVNYKSDYFLDRAVCKIDLQDFNGARSDFYQALQLTNSKGLIYYHMARLEASQANKTETFTALRNAKKYGLFNDVKYFTYIAKDVYYASWSKDKDFIALIQELKFGKK